MEKIVKASLFFVFNLAFLANVYTQHTYINNGTFSTHILDRMEIKSGKIANEYFHTSNKSYRRQFIAAYVDSLIQSDLPLSKQDKFNLEYLQIDNFEWSKSNTVNSKNKVPFLNDFYKKKSALYSVQIPDFNLIINPVVLVSMTNERGTPNVDRAFINTRGFELRGNLTNKIGFYSHVSDEVIAPMRNVYDYFQKDSVIPGAGYYKLYPGNYGYFLYNGYVSLSLNKYMDWQFGHGRNSIGDGFRSFILSEFAPDYNYLKFNTRVWKINYTNIFGQMRDYAPIQTYLNSAKHYLATHHLSINVTDNFSIGAFESIIFQRDSGHSETGFDLNYLNPVIFYKAIENGLNSTDKAVIGTNFKYNFLHHFSLYGQFVLSEFVYTELEKARGWWGNKHAGQLGIKYIDVLNVKNLDLQVEFNYSRPYMYTSYTKLQSYTNYMQPLAHPLGANFYELINTIRYQPTNRLWLLGKCILANYGEDTTNTNWGKNIGLSYASVHRHFGNYIGQGFNCTLLIADLNVSYMFKHNMFLDIGVRYRTVNSDLLRFDRDEFYFSAGIRLNIAQRFYDF